MGVNLDRTKPYLRARAELSWDAKLDLRFAEQRIADDPDHRENRIEVLLGGRTVVLEAIYGLLVYFHRLDADRVAMDLVIDVQNLPDWFVEPTGTWFEQIRLD